MRIDRTILNCSMYWGAIAHLCDRVSQLPVHAWMQRTLITEQQPSFCPYARGAQPGAAVRGLLCSIAHCAESPCCIRNGSTRGKPVRGQSTVSEIQASKPPHSFEWHKGTIMKPFPSTYSNTISDEARCRNPAPKQNSGAASRFSTKDQDQQTAGPHVLYCTTCSTTCCERHACSLKVYRHAYLAVAEWLTMPMPFKAIRVYVYKLGHAKQWDSLPASCLTFSLSSLRS